MGKLLYFQSGFSKFVFFIQKNLAERNVEPRAVLLLDNCSAHPNEEYHILVRKVIAKVLPPNMTSLIQPMDQVVLSP